MRFGECLIELARERGVKRSQLVKTLAGTGIDPSLAYRWLRDERTPKLNSGDRERIAECLGLGEAETERLRDAQVQSLGGQGKLPKGSSLEEVSRILHGGRHGALPFAADPSCPAQPAARLAAGPLWGGDELLQTALALLESLPAPRPGSDREILVTHQGAHYSGRLPVKKSPWLTVLRQALERGYDVVELMRLDANRQRSVRAVEQMLSLLGTAGSYQPHYFDRYGTLACPYDLLVVPQVGALLIFAADPPDSASTGLLLVDPRQAEVLRAHFLGLMRQTQPLLRSYSAPQDALRHLESLARAEEKEGESLLSKPGLSANTQPYSWYQESSNWGKSLSTYGVDLPTTIHLVRQRANAFYKNVQSYRHCEICPKSAIVQMVRQGERGASDHYAQVVIQDRLEHLENVVALVNSFDRYELALLNGAEEEEYMAANFWQVKWDVKGGHRVLLETRSTTMEGAVSQLGLEILEPTVCGAFRHHFLEVFDHKVSPLSKDRRDITLFLEAQIDWLRRHLASA